MTGPTEPLTPDELDALLANWRQQLVAWRPPDTIAGDTLGAMTRTLLHQNAMHMEVAAVWRLLDTLEHLHRLLTALRDTHPSPDALVPEGVTHVCVTCGVLVPCPTRRTIDGLQPPTRPAGLTLDGYVEWDYPHLDGSVEHGRTVDGVTTIHITPPPPDQPT